MDSTTEADLRPCPFGLKEIDALLVPPGKAYRISTGHLITGYTAQVFTCPGKVVFSQTSHIGLVGWLYFKHLLDVITSSILVKVS